MLPAVAAASFGLGAARFRYLAAVLRINSSPCAICLPGNWWATCWKVGAYVFGYLVIAKASLRFYILTEVSQFLLLTLFSHWLIPQHGALGAAQAYMATYIVYFALCSCVFLIYRRRV